jgi:demethylmenaquinone methyltransferase/2-methoxy-6-polyprenyl-1,4-benzoquinol methylase
MALLIEVEDALEEIINDYEKVNHFISLFQDEKIRYEGLSKISRVHGVSLELGSGPGNFSASILNHIDSQLICLDYSNMMLSAAVNRLGGKGVNFIRGVFEYIPIRENLITFIGMAFALRDSLHKRRVLNEIRNVLRARGKLLVIDIGKPDNRVTRDFFKLYMKYVVPLIGSMATKYGLRNPWRMLYKTYVRLPENYKLMHLTERMIGETVLTEKAMGALLLLTAEKPS